MGAMIDDIGNVAAGFYVGFMNGNGHKMNSQAVYKTLGALVALEGIFEGVITENAFGFGERFTRGTIRSGISAVEIGLGYGLGYGFSKMFD